ncbi:MAG: hypothetical protein WBD63_01565 [Phycisphaerae bacterium]|nr:hypothetical protein [Phycisphaerae bacterium]
MNGQESRLALAERVAAAAGAAWWTLLVGFAFVGLSGVMFLAATSCPVLGGWVARLWGVQPQTVRIIWVVSIGVLKLGLFGWFLGSLFLSLWSRRLRRGPSA